jgi:hypothetical protein
MSDVVKHETTFFDNKIVSSEDMSLLFAEASVL